MNTIKFPETNILDVLAKKSVEQAETHFRVRRLEEGDIFAVEQICYNAKINTPYAIIKVDNYGHLDCPLTQLLKVCPFEEIKNHKFIVKGFKMVKVQKGTMLLPVIEKL